MNQLIPPPELSPPSVKHLTTSQKVKLWAQMVEDGDQIVLANLKQKHGSSELARAAAIEWLERRHADHERALAHMIGDMRRRERQHAG
jgi:hypothetical protein